MKYQTKPTVVEAFQYFEDMGTLNNPAWLNTAIAKHQIFKHPENNITYVRNLSGGHIPLKDGYWIVMDIIGDFLVYMPNEFERIYEPCPAQS